MMNKRLFTFILFLAGLTTAFAQKATLVRNGELVGNYYGADAFKSAVNAAAATGDEIVLSTGSFNVPGEIAKSVSIYGQGFADPDARTFLNGKLQYRSTGEGSVDDIHLEGLYIGNHLNLLNDGNRTPIHNLLLVKCFVTGMFLYMDSEGTTLQNCVIQGDIKTYPGSYKATGMLIENCWKDGGSFNCFSSDSEITVRNSIFHGRSISGFDNSTAFIKATWENCVLSNCSLAANSTATNCVLIGVNTSASGVTVTDCQTATSASDVFKNVTSCVYSAGVTPTVKDEFVGTDGTAIGITGGTLGWSTATTTAFPELETTLTKDAGGYYLLGSAADWVEFARLVNIDNTINAKMTDDINLGDDQTMVGDGYYANANLRVPFRGIFDGQGHTLTVNYVTASVAEKYTAAGVSVPSYLGCAPFGYVWGGTIRNLHTAGTITATHEGVAGIVGWTNGSVLIENCHSSVNITYTDGHRGEGGITYNDYNDSHVLTIRDCIYDGTLTAGSNKTGAAGFVVYRAYGTVNIYNSLVAADFANGLGTSDCCTFVRNPNGTISNCHYQTALGTAQGNQATADELANGRTAFYLQAGREDLFWGQEIGVDPMPVLTSDESKRVYRSATGYTNNPAEAVSDQELVPLAYTRDSEGNLTITGFDPGFTPPENYALVIPDEIDGNPVTAIGASAFFQKSNFTSLYIGKNVKTIGNEAFRQAKGITSVTFADDCVVETFGSSAFRGCEVLPSFTMPNTVKTIGEMCFQADPMLASVTLSNQLTGLAPNTFNGCSLLDGVTIPASVTTIGNTAFCNCTTLSTITIPATVTTMGTYVFQGCTALATATLAENTPLTALSEGTFDGCTLLGAFTIPASVNTINANAFRSCTSLTAITFPSTLKTINNYAFQKSGLTTVTVPATITSMGTGVFQESMVETAIVNCSTLGTSSFNACASLKNLTISENVTNIGASAFQNCTILPSVTIPASVTTIGNSAFSGCTLLATVTFASGISLATIPASCFYECRALGSISIPASVTKIDNEAFRRCSAMTEVNFPANTALTTIGDGAFRGCSLLPAITVPESVTSIGQMGFQACTVLEHVTLPSTLQVISTNLFSECKLSDDFIIPSSVTTINNNAFQYTTALGTITIPASVTTMGTGVFYCATGLEEVVFEDGIQLTTIPASTFQQSSIQRCDVPELVTTIGNNAFYQCASLETVTLPQGLTTIGNSAFRYCSLLNNVLLPGTLTSIQDWSFANCTALENLTVEEGVTSINRDVFQYSGMKNVVLPSTLSLIGINLFYQCNSLETLDVSKCVNVWELYYYTSLRGSNTIFYGVPTSTKIILPPYAQATLGANDEVATLEFDLTQDGEGFYLINNAGDWDKFVVYSRNNPTINGRLTADIDLTGHEGKLGVGNGESNYITYKGTFDGQGHTLTTLYKTGKDVAGGLFAYVENATIKYLKVDGTITANNRLIGGFVGFVKPSSTLTMQDCESAVNFTVTPSTTNMHIAGFIGQGKTGNVTLTDCLFTGSITGVTSFRYSAPFLGWMESAGRITYNYCLNNGTFTNLDKNYTYALGVTQNNGQSTAAVCYYRPDNVTNNETLATAVSSDQLTSGQTTYRLQGGREQQHWGQIIGTDPAPRLTNAEGTRVYRGQTYTNEFVEYTGLQKDSEDYYLIGSTVDWEEFALVTQDFPLSNARMTDDVTVVDNTMIGNNTTPYSGIFDGQGHTLTVNYTSTETRVAPFSYITGATIRNLHVEGSVHAGQCGAGLAGFAQGTNNIESCHSSVAISGPSDTYAGFVGDNYRGTLNLTDCVFDGSITCTNKNHCGGFVGYTDNGTTTATNCLLTATFDLNLNSYNVNFLRYNGTVNNSYYLNGLGVNQGTQTNAEELASGRIAFKLQANRDDMFWGQTIGEDPVPVLTKDLSKRVYRTIDGYSNTPEDGALTQDTEGYYLLGSTDDWKLFAMYVDDGMYDIKGRMTADINLGDDQTMIGSGPVPTDHDGTGATKFQGIFDGQGHTLTINYVATDIVTAPFRYIQNATIKNLRVAGNITTSYRHAGGIVGVCYGQQIHSYITGCVSSVNISSSYVNTGDFYSGGHHGGIAAGLNYYGQLHITDCAFNGSIGGESRNVVWGGMMGIPDGTVSFTNCLQVGTFNCSGVIGGSNGSGTFSTVFGNGYASKVNIGSNCYYLNQIGNAQGTHVTADQLADGTIATALQAGREEEVWTQDDTLGTPMLTLFANLSDNVATGFATVSDSSDNPQSIYTLDGRKVSTDAGNKMKKGVYIVNGKKTVIK